MNRPVHATPAQQRRVRGIHDAMHFLLRNIAEDDFNAGSIHFKGILAF